MQFRVSGIYDDRSDNYVRNTAQIYVSKRFWKAAPYEDKKYRKAVYITLKEGAGRKELQEMLHLEENQELTALKSSHEEGGGGVAETVLATAAVMICGALIIYNVFSISVAQDVRFLGKMKRWIPCMKNSTECPAGAVRSNPCKIAVCFTGIFPTCGSSSSGGTP